MNLLQTEFARLYYADAQHALLHDATRSPLRGADGHVRCAVLELARPADWSVLGALWRGVQTELELPAPAIAINGRDGYQLWFSWEQGVRPAQAQAFVQALVARYLPALPTARLRCWPDVQAAQPEDDATFPATVPAIHPHGGQWSAFIAPDLAAVFTDEPWLDRAPGDEAQASVLARLQCMPSPAFAQAWQQLGSTAAPEAPAAATPLPPTAAVPQQASAPTEALALATDSPQAFLRAVMQDPRIELSLRIQAATALLPYSGEA